jgi:nucleoside-diphosphate-sugar epimerase
VAWLLDPQETTILDGDITKPDLGLHDNQIQTLQSEIHFIIHAASSINLIHGLRSTFKNVIQPSETVAKLALQCHHLERFVYVSTAYANSHLHGLSSGIDIEVEERIYPLQPTPQRAVSAEYQELQARWSTIEFESNEFPWAYGYAKHLSERMVTTMFSECGRYHQLLVLRPSVIGPAECFPFPHYVVPTSSPVTMAAAMLANTPLTRLKFASTLSEPDIDSTLDEVPVDVVVDRLLAHMAYGTKGCVHAVSGEPGRIRAQDFHQALVSLRWLPWIPRVIWLREGWHSGDQHWVNRIFKIFGTSFTFLDDSTVALWERLSHKDRQLLRLFKEIEGKPFKFEMIARKAHVKQCVVMLSTRMGFLNRLLFRLLWLF